MMVMTAPDIMYAVKAHEAKLYVISNSLTKSGKAGESDVWTNSTRITEALRKKQVLQARPDTLTDEVSVSGPFFEEPNKTHQYSFSSVGRIDMWRGSPGIEFKEYVGFFGKPITGKF